MEKTKLRVKKKKTAEKESVKDKIEREERPGWCMCGKSSSTKELTERNIWASCKILFLRKIISPLDP